MKDEVLRNTRSLKLRWRMEFRALIIEEYEKFKTKTKDEVSSFNHHSSKSEIFRNPGAKIIHQRPKPFLYLLSSQWQLQQETVHISGCSNRWSVEEYQSWLRLFYIFDIGHGRQLLPFQWNSFQIVPSREGPRREVLLFPTTCLL